MITLDHVQVAAPPGSEREARGFYGKLLGLRELEKPEPLRSRGGVWFAVGDRELHVGVDERFIPSIKAHPALRVAPAHLDALADRLISAGSPVAWDDSLAGVRRFYTEDPWGNRIELIARGGA